MLNKYLEKSDSIEFHYLFKDESHTIDSILRNECEKEILLIFNEISNTLGLELKLVTLPTEEGGFRETWKFIGKNSAQITLIVALATVVISRFPPENKELTELQIENLKLDNQIKRKQLQKLNLELLREEDNVKEQTLVDSVDYVNKNYKIAWRKSNLYKKLSGYNKIDSIEITRKNKNNPVGSSRNIPNTYFHNFILKTDDLPILKLESTTIDVISPAIKNGKFRWKGFHNNEIINFLMNDSNFKTKVMGGNINFTNKFSLEVQMTQDRKIGNDGSVKASNSVVNKVLASIDDGNKVIYEKLGTRAIENGPFAVDPSI